MLRVLYSLAPGDSPDLSHHFLLQLTQSPQRPRTILPLFLGPPHLACIPAPLHPCRLLGSWLSSDSTSSLKPGQSLAGWRVLSSELWEHFCLHQWLLTFLRMKPFFFWHRSISELSDSVLLICGWRRKGLGDQTYCGINDKSFALE